MADVFGELNEEVWTMKLRIVLTVWIYLSSLAALVAGASQLSLAVQVYSPLAANHLGPRAPSFTQSVIEMAPRIPIGLGTVGILSLLAALYFWRSKRTLETKTFAITLMAAFNLALAASLPSLFYIGYFVLPKAANAV